MTLDLKSCYYLKQLRFIDELLSQSHQVMQVLMTGNFFLKASAVLRELTDFDVDVIELFQLFWKL